MPDVSPCIYDIKGFCREYQSRCIHLSCYVNNPSWAGEYALDTGCYYPRTHRISEYVKSLMKEVKNV